MANIWICLLVVGVTVIPGSAAYGRTISKEKALIDYLFNADYSASARPVVKAEDTVNITVGLALVNIYDVDEKNRQIKMRGWLYHQWNDPSLTWTPSTYGMSEVVVPERMVWTPDITLYNYAETLNTPNDVEERVRIDANGTVTWVSLASMWKATCGFNMRHFPYDVQTCHMIFGSWMYQTKEVNMTVHERHGNKIFYKGDEWTIHGLDFKTGSFGSEQDGFYSVAMLRIDLSRHGAYYTHIFVAPSVMLALITLLIFLVPPESNERLHMGVGVVITTSVLLLMLENHLPVEVAEVPVIVSYLLFIFVMVTLTMLLTVFTLNCHHRDIRRGKVPNFVRKIFLERLSPLVCMKADTYSSVPMNDATLLAEGGEAGQNAPIEFTNPSASDFSTDNVLTEPQSALPKSPTMALEKTLDEIRRYLRMCAAKMTQPEPMFAHRQIMINEWHQLAPVVDRLMFFAFLFITFVTTVAMYH